MKKRVVGIKKFKEFQLFLTDEEKSVATIEKYMRDLRCFAEFAGTAEISKQTVLEYKNKLGSSYAVASANSMIAALNSFLLPENKNFTQKKDFRMTRLAVKTAELQKRTA